MIDYEKLYPKAMNRIAELEATQRKTVCICGSMRFRPMMEQCASELTLGGWIVLMPHVFKLHVPDEFATSLDALHIKKIDMAQKVVIVSKDGYMGASTSKEYDYAKDRGKIIEFYNKPVMRDLPMQERNHDNETILGHESRTNSNG